jgi:predicted dehydrogenase
MPLRTAVIGAGVVSDIHMSALDECPRTELVAVCDLDEERARTAARRYGIRAVFDVEELLAEGGLDWVHVCTPVQTHLDIARLAIEAGVPVNIEKPVTETVAEAEELTRLSENYGVPVSVTHQHRFDPAMRAAEARLRAGELGELRAANLLYTGETPPDQANRGEWAFDLVGGEFEEGLPHPLYILLGAAGYPEEGTIRALTQLHGEYERPFGYDGTTVSYRSEAGTLASVTCLGGAPRRLRLPDRDRGRPRLQRLATGQSPQQRLQGDRPPGGDGEKRLPGRTRAPGRRLGQHPPDRLPRLPDRRRSPRAPGGE